MKRQQALRAFPVGCVTLLGESEEASAFSKLFKFARPCPVTWLSALNGERLCTQKPVRRAFLTKGLGLLLISRKAHWLRNTEGL